MLSHCTREHTAHVFVGPEAEGRGEGLPPRVADAVTVERDGRGREPGGLQRFHQRVGIGANRDGSGREQEENARGRERV